MYVVSQRKLGKAKENLRFKKSFQTGWGVLSLWGINSQVRNQRLMLSLSKTKKSKKPIFLGIDISKTEGSSQN